MLPLKPCSWIARVRKAGGTTASCTYTLGSDTQVSAAGGNGSVSVTTTAKCPWGAISNAAWITINGAISGIGNGTLGYSVQANTGSSARSGTITIAGETYTVNQSGSGQSTGGGTFSEYPIPSPDAHATITAAGVDNNMWFVEASTGTLGKITTAGVITEFPMSSAATGAYVGPDGNMWFNLASANKMGKINAANQVTTYPLTTPNAQPGIPIAGPDGNVWFTEIGANKIGRITPGGVVTDWPVPTTACGINPSTR